MWRLGPPYECLMYFQLDRVVGNKTNISYPLITDGVCLKYYHIKCIKDDFFSGFVLFVTVFVPLKYCFSDTCIANIKCCIYHHVSKVILRLYILLWFIYGYFKYFSNALFILIFQSFRSSQQKGFSELFVTKYVSSQIKTVA